MAMTFVSHFLKRLVGMVEEELAPPTIYDNLPRLKAKSDHIAPLSYSGVHSRFSYGEGWEIEEDTSGNIRLSYNGASQPTQAQMQAVLNEYYASRQRDIDRYHASLYRHSRH